MANVKVERKGSYQGVPQWGITGSSEMTPTKAAAEKWARLENAGRRKPIRLLECGCCGQFHPASPLLPGGSANYKNDCRYDANRFSSDEDFKARTGLDAVEVRLDEQNEEN